MFFALAAVLSFVESMLPTDGLLPGVKLGFAHIVTMYLLLTFGLKDGLTLAVLRGGLAFLTRGAIAGLMSLAGGVMSVLVMYLLVRYTRRSYWFLSVCGALTHNLSQLVVSALVLQAFSVLYYYIPILMLSAVVTGSLNALLLRGTMPALRRIPQSYGNSFGKEGNP